jgi:SPFH domain / Band 7 family
VPAILLTAAFLLMIGVVCLALRVVPADQALFVCDRLTGEVLSSVVGPRVKLIVPFLQRVRVLDLSPRIASLKSGAVATRGRESVFVPVFDVLFAFDPQLLTAVRPNEILPFLDDIERAVRSAADYALRAVLIESHASVLLDVSGMRRRAERRVLELLQADLERLAVSVRGVRLLIEPDPREIEATLSTRIRGQELALLAGLDSELDPTRLLELQMLDLAQKGDGRVISTLALPVAQHGDRHLGSFVCIQ